MSKRLLTAAAGVVVLAASAQTAIAGPKPPYALTCGVGGQSGATWSHSKLSGMTFDWATTGGTVSTTVPVFSAHPPHGFAVTVTPVGATSLTVTFHNTDGTDDQVTQACA